MDDSISYSDDETYYYVPRSYNHAVVVPPPLPHQMKKDTSYPQISSNAFYYEVYNKIEEPRNFLPNFSLLEMNSEGLFVVGTNDYTSPIVNGNFIGAEDFQAIVNHNIQKTVFQMPGYSSVSGLKFLEPNMVRNLI
jgi:hypothetical protein